VRPITQEIREQKRDAHAHREQETDPARGGLSCGRQLRHQDRDEDDVVDAEHDLEAREREQRDRVLSGEQLCHLSPGISW